MPEVKAKRQFWQVAVRHIHYLHAEGFSTGVGFFAGRYAEMTGEQAAFLEEAREECEGLTYEAYQEA